MPTHVPKVERYDHFALDTAADEIAALLRGFVHGHAGLATCSSARD